MDSGQWIQPEPPRTPRQRRGWMVTVVSAAAGLIVLFAMIAACSSFGKGLKDGYQSSTTPTTTAAIAATTTQPATTPPTTGMASRATKAGVTVGLPPTTTQPPVVVPTDGPLSAPDPEAEVNVDADPPPAYYSSCKAAKAAGAAPLHRGEPGYSRKLDRDGDGVACET